MFNPQRHPADLTNVNTRIERHGDERKLAADFRLTMKVGADNLNDIEPRLRESLFRTPASGDQPQLVDQGSAFTVVNHPLAEPTKLRHKFPGYEMTLADPASESNDDGDSLFLADVELKKITVEPHEGGSATVTLSASTLIDVNDAAFALGYLIDGDVLVTLTPPTRPQTTDDDSGEDD